MANFIYDVIPFLPSYLGALSFGFMIGYTSPAIPKMQGSNEPLHGKESEVAWFGSVATIGGMLGCPLAGYLVDKIGRKKTLVVTSLPFLFGWLCICLGEILQVLFLGRFLTGLGGGMVCVVCPLYVSETAKKEMRGKFGTAVQLFIAMGIVLIYFAGVYLTWKTMAGMCAVFAVLAMLTSLRVPETPRYLFKVGLKKDALSVLALLRNSVSLADDEFREMENLEEESKVSKVEFSLPEFFTPELYKPLSVAVIIMMFQQLTGINAVMFYTVSIFISAGLKQEQGALATCIVGLVQVLATALAAACMDRAGRRKLLLLAGLGMFLSCFVMAVCFHYQPISTGIAQDSQSSKLGVLVLVSLVGYIVAFSLGWGPIPMLLSSEIFPCRARGAAIGVATFTNWFFAFLVTLYFEVFKSFLGMDGVFALFGLFSFLSIIYVFYYVPETMGRSLEDIGRFFNVRST